MEKRSTARLMAWALVVAMPLWFGSCKKGSDDAVTPSTSAVQGSWRISGYKINPGVDFTGTGVKNTDFLAFFKDLLGPDAVECLTTSTITFGSNGKVTGKEGSKCATSTPTNPVEANSTWKLDGNKLTITDGTDVTVYDTVISGNTLKMSSNEMEDFDGDGKSEAYVFTLELTKV